MVRLKRVLMVFLVLAGGRIQAQEMNLSALIDEALANNPNLDALKSRWAAFEARVPQAGALEDPIFRFEASNIPLSEFDFSSTPMSGNQLMLSQKLSWPGVRRAKEQVAFHSARGAQADYGDRASGVTNMVKQVFFTLAFLDRSIELTRWNEALVRDLIRIAQAKYAVGKGSQQGVLKAQVSLSALKDRLLRLRTRRRTAEVRLNLVLNRSLQDEVGVPGLVQMTPLEVTADELGVLALENRFLLRGFEQSVLKWRAMEAVARGQLRPDFILSFGYRQRMSMATDPVRGSDFFSLGIGVNLPLYQGRKQRKKVVEARAEIRMVEAQQLAARQKVLYEVQVLHLEIEQHRDEVALFESEILPQARQSLESAMAGYQVDKVGFWSLLNDQVVLFNFEIDHYHHVIEHEKRLAELEATVGKRLF